MIRRLVAAAVMLAVAVPLVLLARDAWHWGRAIRDADARAALRPISPAEWQADATLPWGLARRMLGVGDDLDYRRTAMLAIRVAPLQGGSNFRKIRAPIEAALARIVHSDADHARASRAADYLGFLLYTDPPSAGVNPYSGGQQTSPGQTPEQKARSEYETAVRLDPGNADAKRNLEVLLLQSKPQSQKGAPKAGGGAKVGNRGAGAQAPGHGY